MALFQYLLSNFTISHSLLLALHVLAFTIIFCDFFTLYRFIYLFSLFSVALSVALSVFYIIYSIFNILCSFSRTFHLCTSLSTLFSVGLSVDLLYLYRTTTSRYNNTSCICYLLTTGTFSIATSIISLHIQYIHFCLVLYLVSHIFFYLLILQDLPFIYILRYI